MCFFPRKNNNPQTQDRIPEFTCGCCPECLKKKSSLWVLRATMQAKQEVHACMITLTYDSLVHDEHGNVVRDSLGRPFEEPTDSNRMLSKRDCQLFIKRLRKAHPEVRIKYIMAGERGKRTNRAHYHAIIFGYDFPDRRYYKRSKRGNIIYTSEELKKIWKLGICTVDNVNINSAVARYCTKYVSKDKHLDGFMLFSHGLGEDQLYQEFNGKYYLVDGVEYPIPRSIWSKYISDWYKHSGLQFDYRYRNKSTEVGTREYFLYVKSIGLLENYRFLRDNDPVYQDYISYWKKFNDNIKEVQPSIEIRINALDDRKYHHYKIKALEVRQKWKEGIPYPIPRSKGYARYERYLIDQAKEIYGKNIPWWKLEAIEEQARAAVSFAVPSCHYTANDTHKRQELEEWLHSPQHKMFLHCEGSYTQTDNLIFSEKSLI